MKRSRREREVLMSLRSVRKSLLLLLAFLLLLAGVQLGPAVSRAAAAEHYVYLCYPPGSQLRDPAGDVVVVWVCLGYDEFTDQGQWVRIYDWFYSHTEPANNDKTVRAKRYSSSPPYKMYIQSSFGVGSGGGAAVGTMRITNPNGTALNRRIAVRTITEVQTSPTGSFYNCRDSGWVEAPTQRSWWNKKTLQYTQPDCGAGYYRSQVAGRFFSVSLNQWITSNWHYSGSIWLSAPVLLTEPTATPRPHVQNPDDP
jgi:hypothetical protein